MSEARSELFRIFEPHLPDSLLGALTAGDSHSLDYLHDQLDEWEAKHLRPEQDIKREVLVDVYRVLDSTLEERNGVKVWNAIASMMQRHLPPEIQGSTPEAFRWTGVWS